MNNNDYRQFLNDPVTYMGNRGLRLTGFSAPSLLGSVKMVLGESGMFKVIDHNASSHIKKVVLYDDINEDMWCSNGSPNAVAYVRDRAYYLHWKKGMAYSMTLGTEVNLFFTAELSGCCVMVFETNDGPTVFHGNIDVQFRDLKRNEKFNSYYRLLYDYIWHKKSSMFLTIAAKLKPNVTVTDRWSCVLPGFYQQQSQDGKIKIFGVRRNKQWRFYYNLKTKLKNGLRGYINKTEMFYPRG